MSISHSANVVLGWELSEEEYWNLPSETRDNYGIRTDFYSNGEYFVGIILYRVSPGYSVEINPYELIDYEDNNDSFAELLSHIPNQKLKPSIYLCSNIY